MDAGIIFLIVLAALAIFGRYACTYLCPVGWIQELLYKIPVPKKIKDLPHDRQLRYAKWGVLALVIAYVFVAKYIPDTYGWWLGKLIFKIVAFSGIFLLSLFVMRPFCKYLCPIGLTLGLFNRLSPFRYRKKDNCVSCGLCRRDCKMSLDPQKEYNGIECIRCGRCKKTCPKHSLVGEYFYCKAKEEGKK